MWLQHPATDDALTDTVIAWVRTPDWTASRAYLDEHFAALLTDDAEAALEHLIDANPATAGLRDYLGLLQAARARGLEGAYAAHQQQLLTAHLTRMLDEWIGIRTWAASQNFATGHADELLHPGALAILDSLGGQDPGAHVLRVHRGLLAYATSAGFDAAYRLRADGSQLPASTTQPIQSCPPACAWPSPGYTADNLPTTLKRISSSLPRPCWQATPGGNE